MTEQRMVPVELLLGAAIIAEDDGAYHTASALRAIIDGPGVEPFAYYVYFPDAQDGEFCDDLDDLIDRMTNERHEVTPLYLAAPSAPVQRLPEGCAWAVTNGGHSICQPPKSWDKQAPGQAVACPTDKEK